MQPPQTAEDKMSVNPQKPYSLKYTLEPEIGPFSKEECEEAGGGCDALVLISMMYPENGTYSQTAISFDGRNDGKLISDVELWKVWAMLGTQLEGSDELRAHQPWKSDVLEMVRHTILEVIEGPHIELPLDS